MLNCLMKIFSFLLAFLLYAPAAFSAPQPIENLERLRVHLENIETKARQDRYWGGGFLLAGGIGFGIAALTTDRPRTATGYGIVAGVMGATGGFTLAFPSEQESMPQLFSALPEANDGEKIKKISVGETYLNHLADTAKFHRYLSGGTSLAAAGIFLVLYGSASQAEDWIGLRRVYLIEAVILGSVGLARLIIESGPELERRSYENWQDKRRGMAWNWGVAPLPKGGAFVAGVRF